MDILKTHTLASPCEAFPPGKAKTLWDATQCLNRCIADIQTPLSQVTTWQAGRDQIKTKISWQCTADTARTKLKRLYTTLGD